MAEFLIIFLISKGVKRLLIMMKMKIAKTTMTMKMKTMKKMKKEEKRKNKTVRTSLLYKINEHLHSVAHIKQNLAL